MTYSDENAQPFEAQWDDQFKGIYLPLPLRCYSSDGRYLLVRTISGSRAMLFVFDLVEKKLHRISSPIGPKTSVHGLAIFDHFVAVNVVDCRTTFRLFIFDLKSLTQQENGWHLIAENSLKKDELENVDWTLDRFFPDGEKIPVESYYVHSTNKDNKRPLMVLVHGGPNSNVFCKFHQSMKICDLRRKKSSISFSVDYYLGVMAYVSLGFDVLIVNYRGSIGFGQGKSTIELFFLSIHSFRIGR